MAHDGQRETVQLRQAASAVADGADPQAPAILAQPRGPMVAGAAALDLDFGRRRRTDASPIATAATDAARAALLAAHPVDTATVLVEGLRRQSRLGSIPSRKSRVNAGQRINRPVTQQGQRASMQSGA